MMNVALDPGVDRFRRLFEDDQEAAELWRKKVIAFCNLYAFLSQIMPYQDSDLERSYIFLRHLLAKLPNHASDAQYDLNSEVRLEYYRLQKMIEGSIDLQGTYARRLDGPQDVGTAIIRETDITLAQLIDVVNERFGTDFNQADQLFFDQLAEVAANSEELQQAAQVNSGDKFVLLFKRLLESLFIERIDQNEMMFARYMNDPEFQRLVAESLGADVYQRLTGKELATLKYKK